MTSANQFPRARDPELVGSHLAFVKSAGGNVWDDVPEYRVWCHPEQAAADEEDGSDCYYAFEMFDVAEKFSRETPGAEEPLALIVQQEFISEPQPGVYLQVRERRIAEWPVEFLSRPRRTERTIANFMAADAPTNRLDVLRGLAPAAQDQER